MKTIEQLKIPFSPKDVSYNLTKSHQVLAASIDYSRSCRRKPPLPAEDRVNCLNGTGRQIFQSIRPNEKEVLESTSEILPHFYCYLLESLKCGITLRKGNIRSQYALGKPIKLQDSSYCIVREDKQ